MSTELGGIARPYQTLRFSVPSRSYVVDYEVLKDRRLPLVEEFLLRAIAIADSVDPAAAAQFLGLSDREFSKCLERLEFESLVSMNQDGRLELSGRAIEHMKNVDGVPRFSEVETRQTKLAIDLISFQAEQGAVQYGPWFKHSIEVDRRSRSKEQGADKVRAAFEHAFYDLKRGAIARVSNGGGGDGKAKLHRVQKITGRDYFNWPLETDVVLLPDRPLRTDFGFSQFTKVSEVEARRELFSAVRAATQKWIPAAGPTNLPGFEEILHATPAQGALRRGRLDEEFFVTLGLERIGEGTDPTFFVGDFSQSAVIDLWSERLADAIDTWKVVEKSASYPLLWLPPESGLWARSDAVRSALEHTRMAMQAKRRELFSALLVPIGADGHARSIGPARHKDMFDAARSVDASGWPQNVEVVLVPDKLAAVFFHLRPTNDCVIPVVAGLITSEPDRLAALEKILAKHLGAAMSDPIRDWRPEQGLPEVVSKAMARVMWEGR
jgi:hypothetical protein